MALLGDFAHRLNVLNLSLSGGSLADLERLEALSTEQYYGLVRAYRARQDLLQTAPEAA